jgi:hypothetical protein
MWCMAWPCLRSLTLSKGWFAVQRSRCLLRDHSEPPILLGHGHLEFKVVTFEQVVDLPQREAGVPSIGLGSSALALSVPWPA